LVHCRRHDIQNLFQMKKARIAFIGCGNMGRSLIGGLIANAHDPALISGADPDPAQRERINNRFGVTVYENNAEAIRDADVVVLAIKPQMMQKTLKDLDSELVKRSPLLISVAAGIRLDTIDACLSAHLPVIRVMPNTPALIQAGATVLFANDATTPEQRDLAEGIMRSVGSVTWLEDEELMDTVTALSGSGPAYFFLIMEVMEKAATTLGLPPDKAKLLTLETAFGAAKMALESESDAATLRKQVTSPGGTTEQALRVLMEQGNIEKLFLDALSAAKQRSEELAQSIGES
jgi:pyrroline-5-carboxylate reductase